MAKKDFPPRPDKEKADPLEQALAGSGIPDQYRNFARGLTGLSSADRESQMASMAGVNADFAEVETQNSIRSFLSSYDQMVPRRESSTETSVNEVVLSSQEDEPLSSMRGAVKAATERLAKKTQPKVSEGPGAIGGTGFRGRERNPRISLGYKGYRMGDIVMAKRSDGSVEYDWQFMHQRLDTGEIVLRKKTEDGKIIEKEIMPNDFNETQKLPRPRTESQTDARPPAEEEALSPKEEQESAAPVEERRPASPEDQLTAEPEAEKSSQDSGNPTSPKFRPAFWSKDWVEAKEVWKNVFRDATIGYDAEAWAESSDGPGAEKLLHGVNDLIIGLTSSRISSETLKKYSVRIHTDGPTRVFGDTVRVSAETLMKRGPQEIAELLAGQIDEVGNEQTEISGSENKKETAVPEQREGPAAHIGDFVVWETNGTLRFKEPLQIKRIEEDPKSKKPFAFFDEFLTGVPVNELVVSERVVESEQSKTKEVLRRSDINEAENGDFSAAAQRLLRENGFREGNKVIFFAEREREGVLEKDSDGSLKIRDAKGLPWGITAILSASNSYIRRPDIAVGQTKDDFLEPEHESQNPTPNSDTDVEVGTKNRVEQQPINLDAAREAYVKAYGEYNEKHGRQTGNIFNIGGDLSALQAARAVYDAAWKAAAEAGQKELLGGFEEREGGTEIIQARIRGQLQKTFVIDEEKTLAGMKASRELPPQEEKWYKQAWTAYARLPQWQRIAISTAIGAGVALGGGAIAGTALTGAWAGGWALRRASSLSASFGLGAATAPVFAAWDKTFGKKGTKEYKIEKMASVAGNVSDSLENWASEYQRILEETAHREEKQMYLRAAIAAIAGAATSIGFGAAFAHDVPATGGGAGVDHAATSGAHAGPPEHVAPADIRIDKDSSLWKTVEGQLKGKNPDFDHLNPEQQTYVISSLSHDEIRNLGLQTPDHLPAGFKIDPNVFNDDHLKSVLDHARHLTAGQEHNIAANNEAILREHQAYPHEQMTTGRVAQIISAREHPAPLPQTESVLPGDAIISEHAVTSMPLAAHDIPVAAAVPENLTPAGFERSLQSWSFDAAQGQQMIERLQDVGHASPADIHHLLLMAAQKVGDSHPVNINPADTAAVARQLKDYMVIYPEARPLGFTSYDQWAGISGLSMKKFLDEATVAPRAGDIRSALQHTFFHRGVHIQELLRNGKLHKVPLADYHLALARALHNAASNPPAGTTVGDFIAEHHAAMGDHIANAKGQIEAILHNAAQGSKSINSNDILNR
jgi:hypothetical protein